MVWYVGVGLTLNCYLLALELQFNNVSDLRVYMPLFTLTQIPVIKHNLVNLIIVWALRCTAIKNTGNIKGGHNAAITLKAIHC